MATIHFRRCRSRLLCGTEVPPGSSRLAPMMRAIACSAIASKRRWWRGGPDPSADRTRRRGIRSSPTGDPYRARTFPGGPGSRFGQWPHVREPARTWRTRGIAQDLVPTCTVPRRLGHRNRPACGVGAWEVAEAHQIVAGPINFAQRTFRGTWGIREDRTVRSPWCTVGNAWVPSSLAPVLMGSQQGSAHGSWPRQHACAQPVRPPPP